MTLTDDAPLPDELPPPCYAAECRPQVCPDRFAEWVVCVHCPSCPVALLCTPCKERWERYGNVCDARRLR